MAKNDISTKTIVWFEFFTRSLEEKNLLSEREAQAIKRKIEAQRQQTNTPQKKHPADQCESTGCLL